MEDKQVPFAPFHALNQFMVDDYRLHVIQTVLRQADTFPGNIRGSINALIRKYVSVPGFRNSAQAPLPLKIKNSVNAFEGSPEFTAKFLQAWAEINHPLRQQVYELLQSRGWEMLPLEADRTALPGFIAVWKKGETYDELDKGFSTMFPDSPYSVDDIRLMVVWVSNRLPFDMDEETEEKQEN